MQKLEGVLLTDEVAKDGSKFDINALEDIVWKGNEGQPFGVSHDFHRNIGWSKVVGLYLSNEMSYVMGKVDIPENSEEMAYIQKKRELFWLNSWNEKIKPHKEAFTQELLKFEIEPNSFFYTTLVMYHEKNIVYKAFPQLKERLSDGQMIKIEDLVKDFEYLGQGIFKDRKSEIAIMFHPYFRRALSIYNNYNTNFIDLLLKLYEDGNKSVQILLDPDYLGYAPSFSHKLEYDYWYGPKYNDDISSIPSGLSRYITNETDKFFSNVVSTDFLWKKKDDGKYYQFEAEELVDINNVYTNDKYGCRYLHAMYDLEKEKIIHLDGAIRQYSRDQIEKRQTGNMAEVNHEVKYQKIFRIDDSFSVTKWKELVTQYLYSNPLVYEYFGINSPVESFKNNEHCKGSLQQYVPYIIHKGDGIRMLVSYFDGDESQKKSARHFIAKDELTYDGNKYIFVDYYIVEIYKILNRIGANIELPSNVIYLDFNDQYIYVPPIHHNGNNLEKDVNETLRGIKMCIDSSVKMHFDNVYSFSISWTNEGKTFSLAFMGHENDLKEWLDCSQHIPINHDDFITWIENQNGYIKSHGRKSISPLSAKLIQHDGVLFFRRRNIANDIDMSNLHFDETNKKFFLKGIDELDDELKENILNHKISITRCYIVKSAMDEKSNVNYLLSENCAALGETNILITDIKCVGLMWKYLNSNN